jgi:hypothetical protein
MRLTVDARMPLVRRLVHGLRFCSLLSECKLRRVASDSYGELISLLEDSATEGVGELFQDRQPPSAATMFLFRQAAVHYIRSHPGFPRVTSWHDRWRLLRISGKFARGKGRVPQIHPGFPESTFDMLERPLGPLAPEITAPLQQFFEAHVTSKYYAIVGHRRPFVTSYRSLVLGYPTACWLLRLAIGDREPTVSDVVDLVVALDSGHGLAAIARSSDLMAAGQQLERLVAWYAR